MRDAIDRRFALLAGGALALGGGLLQGGCSRREGRPAARNALRVSVVGKGDGDTELLLRTSKLDNADLPIEYIHFDSGHLVVEALNSGAVDYGGMSEIPPVFAAGTLPHSFRQIAVAHGDVNNQVILVPRGSAIDSLKDLRGKKVGYVRATTSQYFLIRMLQSVGLTWADITPVAMNVADGAAAFSSGRLDAWAIYGFPIQRAMATEGARILKTALGFLSGNYIVTAHVDALADPAKSALIARYLRQTKLAYAWAAAHQDQWAQVVAQAIGVPLAHVQDQFRRKSDSYTLRPVTAAAIASQQAVADVFASAKLIPKAVDVQPLWDNRFNRTIEGKA
ncbi:ABC transporter substrate-binding protein [Phenylobacterium sp. LjRoot225]|uniref:ABC transporter substrate-binding protein n=1 Tax=Phenylobacterium sp. LjRoot225 TaxID=3342285 RepID=UPI003ECCC6BD